MSMAENDGGMDPATMDALNALGTEIEGEAVTEAAVAAAVEPAEPVEPQEPAEGVDPAPEPAEAASEPAEGDPATPPKKKTAVEKDIDRLLRQRYAERNRAEAAERERDDLRRQLAERAAAPAPVPAPTGGEPAPAPAPVRQQRDETPEHFEQRVQAEAARIQDAREFDAKCNAVFTRGMETHKDFGEARDGLVQSFGRQMQVRPEFLQAITRLDNGQDVFRHLGVNLQEADKLFGLSPVDLVMEVGQISAKLKTPKVNKLSAAPAPITPVRGAARTALVRLADDAAPVDKAWANEFIKTMNT